MSVFFADNTYSDCSTASDEVHAHVCPWHTAWQLLHILAFANISKSGIVEDHILEAVRPSLPSTLVRYSATTYSGVPSPPRNAEWPVLRSISYSLLKFGIPSCYTRWIGCGRHAHITLLQSVVCLLATHVQAVGGHPLQWGAATFGSSATHVQAVGCHPLQWEAATSGSSTPSWTTSSGVKRPGGYFLHDSLFEWALVSSGRAICADDFIAKFLRAKAFPRYRHLPNLSICDIVNYIASNVANLYICNGLGLTLHAVKL